MEMKKSEVFDRWTILLQKARFNDLAKKELETQFDPEVSEILAQAIERGMEFQKGDELKYTDITDFIWSTRFCSLLKSVMKLQEANAKIWVLEASIRKEFKNDPVANKDLEMSEVGERALQIRDFNSLRIQAKKEIDNFFGEITDVKVDHASST